MSTDSALRPGLVLPVRTRADGVGGPTPEQARGPYWRRTSRGFYVPSNVDGENVEQRIVEASVVTPPAGAVCGWAALRWLGGHWFTGTTVAGAPLPVTIVVGTHDIRAQRGIAVSAEGFNPAHKRDVEGVVVCDPRYATSFEMRYAAGLVAAVIVLDMAAYSDLVSIEELDAFVTPKQNGWTGVPLARKAVGLAVENSWSPAETRMRLLWVLVAGLPTPLANRPLFDHAGHHIGTPDLVDPVHGVVGEYDGTAHLQRDRRNADVVREAGYRSHGLEVVVMTAADGGDPTAFLRRLAEAYDRARRTSVDPSPLDRRAADVVGADRDRRPAARPHTVPATALPLLPTRVIGLAGAVVPDVSVVRTAISQRKRQGLPRSPASTQPTVFS